MSWIYKDKIFTEEDIGSFKGFVYEITDLVNNKKYIGQKVFYNKVSKKPLKGKVNKRISKKQSDWQEYYGSNDQLKELAAGSAKENFRREILRLCMGKAEMNYHEAREIFIRDALLKDEYYNSWVSTRINANQLKNLNV